MTNDTAKKRGEYDKWETVQTGNNESVTFKEKPRLEPITYSAEQPQAPTEGFLATLRKVGNFLLGAAITAGILLVGVLGHIGWEWFYGQNEFSEMQATLAQHGHELEASRLAEVGKVCKNGAGTPLACQALYFKKETELAMMAGGLR